MQWLNDLPFGDNRVVQIGLLAACGIAALVALAIVYRLVFAHRLRVPGGRTRQPRLGLVDAFSLDGQRQLVLVRRDNVEHLVMIGGPNDVLLESQINRAHAAPRENGSAVSGSATPLRRRTDVIAGAPPSAGAPVTEAASPGESHAPPPHVSAEAPSAPIRAVVKPQLTPPPQPAPVPPHAPEAAPAPAASASGPPLATPAASRPSASPSPASSSASSTAPVRRSMPPPIAPVVRANVVRPQETKAPSAAPAPQAALAISMPEATPAPRPVEAHPTLPAPPPSKSEKTEKAEPAAVHSVKKEAQPQPKPPETGPASLKAGPHEATIRISPIVNAAPTAATEGHSHPPHPQPGLILHAEPKMTKADGRGMPAPAAHLGAAAQATPLDAHLQPPQHEAQGPALRVETKLTPKADGRGLFAQAAPAQPAPVAPAAPSHPAPVPNATARPAPAAPPAPAPPPTPAEKPVLKPDDPFAGLDSLEAEMAKLLGREKLT